MHTVPPRNLDSAAASAFLELIGADRSRELQLAAGRLRRRLGEGTLWHVNSTAAGGGVAEMLHVLVPLYRRLGVPVRWAVIDGDERFFDATKRLGNLAYGSTEPGDRLDAADVDYYLSQAAVEAKELASVLAPQDVVLLHDHQTAALVPEIAGQVRGVHWRCHVGVDAPTAGSEQAWEVLAPLLTQGADAAIFSIPGHIPDRLSRTAGLRTAVIPPVIWPFAPKNEPLTEAQQTALAARAGIAAGRPPGYVVTDGPGGRPDRWDPATPLVVQVSRWDRLKDMHAVLTGFAAGVPDARLALVGPNPAAIADDVEQQHWFTVCRQAWSELSAEDRGRIRLVCLPMTDLDDNARLVNAVQRAADVVVQKSLAEGFGLTVAEAMWKGRAVVGSAVGGIAAQIEHGRTGLLLTDPGDLGQFAELVAGLTTGRVDGHRLGEQARRHVLDTYLPDGDLLATEELLAAR